MANTAELIETVCKLIEISPLPIPIALMDHSVEETATSSAGKSRVAAAKASP
jgi:hypothetical protein